MWFIKSELNTRTSRNTSLWIVYELLLCGIMQLSIIKHLTEQYNLLVITSSVIFTTSHHHKNQRVNITPCKNSCSCEYLRAWYGLKTTDLWGRRQCMPCINTLIIPDIIFSIYDTDFPRLNHLLIPDPPIFGVVQCVIHGRGWNVHFIHYNLQIMTTIIKNVRTIMAAAYFKENLLW